MKRKTTRNAFTLIELLAVIVILAIIALIAVPVILNIIDKANKSAFKDSAYGVLNTAEYFYAASQLELEGPKETVEMETTDSRLELKGSIPNGKVIITRDGEIALAVSNERYCVTKGFNEDDITITDEFETCEPPTDGNTGSGEKTLSELATTSTEITSIPACITDGTTCVEGTPVAVKVNNNDKVYNFYVIKDKNNKVTLIMDRNIGARQAWVTEGDYTSAGGSETDYGSWGNNNKGPITILKYLTSQIEIDNWENIPAIKEYEYKNNPDETGATKQYGYQKLTITNGTGVLTSTDSSTTTLAGTMRARLLTYEEVTTLKTNNGGATPTWLYTNLSKSNNAEKPYGYWLLSDYPTSSYNAKGVYYDGTIGFPGVDKETFNGARPVITLSK